jgi:hypothetical protein
MYFYAGGSGASAYMQFYTNDAERMRITSGGNVGIGTCAPNAKLTVWTPSTTGLQTALRLNNPFGFDNLNTGAQIIFSQDRSVAEDLKQGIIAVGQQDAGTSATSFMAFYTNNTGLGERLRITSTGIACFSNTVCSSRFVGPLTGTVTGMAQRAQTGCVMSSASSDVTVYFTSGIVISYGVNDYTVVASPNDNAAAMSSTRVVIPYNYYAGTLSTTVLASYIDSPNSHSVLAVSICKVVNSNTNCLAVRFAKSSGNVTNTYIQVTTNGMNPGND